MNKTPGGSKSDRRARPKNPWAVIIALIAGAALLAVLLIMVNPRGKPGTEPQPTSVAGTPQPPAAPAPASPAATPPKLQTSPGLSLAEAYATAAELPVWSTSEPGKPIVGDPSSPDFNDAAWLKRPLPWDWTGGWLNNDGKREVGTTDTSNWGVERTGLRSLWFRTSFDLPAGWKGKPLALSLGAVGDKDETFLNGTKLGGRTDPLADRSYLVPPGVLKDEANVVAVYVRHEAPGVQQAHTFWYWGCHSLGEYFWPAGIWEKTPSVRLASALEIAAPKMGPGPATAPDVPVPPQLKQGEPEPAYDLTIDLGQPDGGPFYQATDTIAEFTVRVQCAAGMPPANEPDSVRLQVLGHDAKQVLQRDLPAAVKPGSSLDLTAALDLPGPGWYRVNAVPLKAGEPLAIEQAKLGGKREINFAVFLPHDVKLIEGSRFGIAESGGLRSDAPAEAINAIGGRWLRWDIVWDHFEHVKDKYTFDNPQIGGTISLCKQYQIAMVPCYTYCAEWAVHPEAKKTGKYWVFSPPATEEDYRRATRDFAQHFKGDIRVYELWNEPMLCHFLICVKGGGFGTYLDMIYKPAADEIRKADPNAKILFASQWAEPFGDALRALKDTPDIVSGCAIHPYSEDEPELGTFARVSTLTSNVAGNHGARWQRDASGLRWMEPARPNKYEVWNTEVGWFPSKKYNRRTIASFIPRAYCASAFRGQVAYCYFSLGGNLFTDDCRQAQPAAVAYSTTSYFLENTKPVSLLLLRRGLPCYVFQGIDDPTRFVGVMWTQGLDYYCLMPKELTVHDIQGRIVTPRDGAVRVTEEALFLTLTEPAGDAAAARAILAAIDAHGAGSGTSLGLWMKSGDAETWAKRIAEVPPDAPLPDASAETEDRK